MVPNQPAVTGITRASPYLYWSQDVDCVTNPNVGNGSAVCDGVIRAVSLFGGSVMAVPGSDHARSVAADSNCVYWTTSGQFHVAGDVQIWGAPLLH